MKEKNIEVTRTIPCGADEVWKKWTTREGLLSFFGPDNRVELRLGGYFEIYFLMDSPEGLRGGEGNRILSYLPERMLSFTWNAPPEFEEIRNHEHKTWVVLELKEMSARETEVILTHLGWLEGDEWDRVFDYFARAWERVLDSLKESCS